MSGHKDDGTGRCEHSELLVTECAGCLGHSDPVVDQLLREGSHGDGPGRQHVAEPEGAAIPDPGAFPFVARYHGGCTASPGCPIRPGDQIIATRAGTYMHHPSCPPGKR